MQLNPLTAISPIDGRYFNTTSPLSAYFSEFALIRYRIRIEVEYFIALCEWPLPELKAFPKDKYEVLRSWYIGFSESSAERIKELEKTTNHDVKAVEYFLKELFDQNGLKSFREFIHFGLTSQDINNSATPLLLKEFMNDLLIPRLLQIIQLLDGQARQWKDVAMLAMTHGQPASPTRLGKEIAVFSQRIKNQLKLTSTIPHAAKFGGATGNFNAHSVAYPDIPWHSFADKFIGSLDLERSHPTTQIEHYDHLAALLDNLKRINTIFIDYSRDVWQYISLQYFTQKIKQGEVGSSAMPHKVNPIDFENAEGNFGLANALFEHLSAKLPISRLQRDLTDSTVLRNLGVPLAHTYLALQSLEKGISKLELNQDALNKDLENNWAVVAEGIQTVLRMSGYPDPYEALKGLTRKNEKVTKESIAAFIDGLKVDEALKKKLKAITPFNYTGL